MRMKPRFGSIIVRGLVALVVVWAALGVVAVYKTRKVRTDAGEFLKDFTQLQVGKATLDEVRPLVDGYHGEWRTYGLFPPACCGPGSKMAEFVFDNHWQHWFFFTPLTVLGADIGINGNGVCDRSMSLFTVTKAPLGVSVHEFPEGEQPGLFHSRLNIFKTIVTLTVSASSAQRTAAYSVNLDCLTKLRGCRDAREMAPATWQNSREVAPSYWKSQWDD